jgi:hypothetical protein
MGKILMENWNKSVKKLLPAKLVTDIENALIQSEDKPDIPKLTGYGVLSELGINKKLTSELLRRTMAISRRERRKGD